MKRKLNSTMSDDTDKAMADELVGNVDGDWVVVETGSMKGTKIATDKNTGMVVSLSTRQCVDAHRWLDMPSLDDYVSLRDIDLHKSRYLTSLHPSVCALVNLETLILTRCERLISLPRDIGNMTSLKEVRNLGVPKERKIQFLTASGT